LHIESYCGQLLLLLVTVRHTLIMADTQVMGSRWADEIDDEDYEIPTSQQPVVHHAAKEGERVVTEIRVDPDTGKKQKVLRTFKIEKKLVSKNAIERRKWAKYGQSTRDGPGINPATTAVADEVMMQFLNKDTDAIPEENAITKLQKEGKGVLRCRFCQDNHFSAKCPYKDSGLPPEYFITKELEEPKKQPVEMESKVYQAPKGRAGRGETMGSVPKKDYTIRVSNLPESMSETDMQELCSPFGKTERIFLAKDRATGVCKGFAFVTYQTKEGAMKALNVLNGYGYDHLILNVEWSKPTQN